ncbi:MAG: hypothetical protein R3E13_10235 [Alphaproteobacteria bacterium]
MTSLCFVTTVPFGKRNLPFRKALKDAGFELHDIKYNELSYPGSLYDPARGSDLVVIDCDSPFLSRDPEILKTGLMRLKDHFGENSKVFATGTNMSKIIEACRDTPVFALDTGCRSENTASLILNLLET